MRVLSTSPLRSFVRETYLEKFSAKVPFFSRLRLARPVRMHDSTGSWRLLCCIVMACSLSSIPPATFAANVNLSWSADTEPDLASYKAYYGTSSRNYSTSINVGKVTSYTLTGLNAGTYYFAVTASDTSGNESGFSNEAILTIPSTPPPSDTTPPVISGVGASSITTSSAAIKWTTDEASDTQVDYGVTTSYGSSTTLASALVTSHSASLSGLQASKLYHYRVKSKDASNNLATSGDFTFTTSGDTTAPTISAVGTSSITTSGAAIKWTTNEASDSQVEFGTTTGYGSSTSLAASLVTSHSVSLTGLQTSKLYHYRVKSKDGGGNLATSGDFTFTTAAAADTTAPTISAVGATSIAANGATIKWTTNETSDTQVEYGTTTSYGSSTVLAASLVTSHSAALSGLQTSKLYHYRVKSRDNAGNLSTSVDFTFTTAGDTSPPVVSRKGVSWITAVGAAVNWTTDEPGNTQVEFGTTTTYGNSSALSSSLVISHAVHLSGLKASTLYHYRVKSSDKAKNLTTSADGTFTTGAADTAAPLISGVGATDITSSAATVSWKTSEPGDSLVNYGLTTSYGSYTSTDGSLTTSHAQLLSGLSAGKLYHFRVRSRDATGNVAWSSDFTFKTLTTSGTLPTLVTFDKPVPAGTSNSPLSGLLQGVDFGGSGWRWEGSYGPDTTRHIYFDSATGSSRTFTFSPAPKILNSLRVFSTSSGTLTLSDNLGQKKSQALTTGSVQLVTTSWTKGSTTVKVNFGGGWNLGVDDIKYSAVVSASPLILSSEPQSLLTMSTAMATSSGQAESSTRTLARKVFMPSVIETPIFRTDLGINNLSDNLASVRINLFNRNGDLLNAATVQVGPRGLKQINHVVQFLYPGFSGEMDGSLNVESDQPICVWSSQITNPTDDPAFSFGHSRGASKILIASGGGVSPFSSSLSILNIGTSVARISIKAYDASGVVIGQTQTTTSLSPKAVLRLDSVQSALGTSDNFGSLEVASLNDIPLLATSHVSTQNDFGGTFEGLNSSSASRSLVVPNVVDRAELGTNLSINNVNDRSAHVTVHLKVQDGSELGALEVTLPPKGLTQLTDVIRQLLQTPWVSNLEGYIELGSDEPILAWASQIDRATNDLAVTLSQGQGANRLLVPSASNVGAFRSGLALVNTGNGEAFVDILSRAADGEIQGQLRNVFIPAKGCFSWADILESLGITRGSGSLEIISTNGQPLVGTSRVRSASRGSGFLAAVPVE